MPTETLLPKVAKDARAASKLHGQVILMRDADPKLYDQLFDLFRQYYANVDRDAFDRDQAEKEWLLLLTDSVGTVRGFTTMAIYETEIHGRRVRALFSGNTIIDQAFWGEQELVRTFGDFLARLKRQAPAVALYWFLICSGYRTYSYLRLFYREFFPRHDRPTPEFEASLIRILGEMKFPDEYRDGVVHVAQPRECLRSDLAVPGERKLRNPHIRYFVEENPGYLRGNELVCIAEFSVENTRGIAQRIAREILS